MATSQELIAKLRELQNQYYAAVDAGDKKSLQEISGQQTSLLSELATLKQEQDKPEKDGFADKHTRFSDRQVTADNIKNDLVNQSIIRSNFLDTISGNERHIAPLHDRGDKPFLMNDAGADP